MMDQACNTAASKRMSVCVIGRPQGAPDLYSASGGVSGGALEKPESVREENSLLRARRPDESSRRLHLITKTSEAAHDEAKRRSSDRASTEQESHQPHNQKHEEQNLRDTDRSAGDSAETQYPGYQRDDQKHQRPMEHVNSFQRASPPTTETASEPPL
jgi:hypothetical protein